MLKRTTDLPLFELVHFWIQINFYMLTSKPEFKELPDFNQAVQAFSQEIKTVKFEMEANKIQMKSVVKTDYPIVFDSLLKKLFGFRKKTLSRNSQIRRIYRHFPFPKSAFGMLLHRLSNWGWSSRTSLGYIFSKWSTSFEIVQNPTIIFYKKVNQS